jgi:hypothetical protein
MHKDFYEETGSPTQNDISRSQGSKANCIPRCVGAIQCACQDYAHDTLRVGGDDCCPESPIVIKRRNDSVGGIIRQLINQNRALIEQNLAVVDILQAQNELLSQITFSDNSEEPDTEN